MNQQPNKQQLQQSYPHLPLQSHLQSHNQQPTNPKPDLQQPEDEEANFNKRLANIETKVAIVDNKVSIILSILGSKEEKATEDMRFINVLNNCEEKKNPD